MHQLAEVTHQVSSVIGGVSVICQCLVQAIDGRSILRERGWMEGDHLRNRFASGKLFALCVPFGPEFWQDRIGLVIAEPAFDKVLDSSVEFTLRLFQPCFGFGTIANGVAREALALVVIGLHVGLNQFRIVELGAHAVQNGSFDPLEAYAAGVVACAALTDCRTSDADPARLAAVVHRHAGTTRRASEKPGQKMWRPSLACRRKLRLRRLQRLSTLPCPLIDDAKMVGLHGRAFAAIVGPRDAPTRFRVFDHAHFVPHDAAGVELIEDDAIATRSIAVDRRSVPLVAPGRLDALAIETAGDLSWRPSSGVVGEDAAHDSRLALDDFEFSLDAWARPIAIGSAAGVPAGPHDAHHTAAHFLGAVFPEKLAHESTQADHDSVGLTIVNGAYFDAGERQSLVDAGEIFHVARQAVERFHHDDVEALRLGLRHEVDEAVAAEDRGAGPGLVLEADDGGQAFSGAIGATERNLIVNRLFVLQVGRKPSVDRGARHRGPL